MSDLNELQYQAMARAYALQQLSYATEKFREKPSVEHWEDMRVAMLVYQQVMASDPESLFRELRDKPLRLWDDGICKAGCDCTVHEAFARM